MQRKEVEQRDLIHKITVLLQILSSIETMKAEYDELIQDGETSSQDVSAQLQRVQQFDKELMQLVNWIDEMQGLLSSHAEEELEMLDSSVIEKLVNQLEVCWD